MQKARVVELEWLSHRFHGKLGNQTKSSLKELVGMKSNVPWRLQKTRNVRSVKYLQRKVAGCEWSQPCGEAVWVATSKAMGRGYLYP